MWRALLLALLLASPVLAGAPELGGVPLGTDTTGNAILLVGDSWIGGRITDEPWANYGGGFNLVGGGFVSRMQRAIGSVPSGAEPTAAFVTGMGQVHAGSAVNTGTLFGPNSDFDVVAYVKVNPKIRDVVFIIGTNDYGGGDCSHGVPVDPATAATGVCTYDDTYNNMEYVTNQLAALGVYSYWNVSPGLIGHVLLANAEAILAVENMVIDFGAFCTDSAKQCAISYAMYAFACKGTEIVDPGGGIYCNATGNSFNYGPDDVYGGAGNVNRSNPAMFFNEDTIHGVRSGFGVSRIHPSGWGYQRAFRELMSFLASTNATTGIKNRFFAFNLSWDGKIPPIPTVTLGTVAATSIQVTPSHGTYVNGNGSTQGQCYLGDCYYVCWASCRDFASADPSCSAGAEADVERDPGAPMGAQHRTAESTIDSHRDVVILQDGETGLLTGLTTATDYGVVCVAMSPTAVSHPGVRIATTP